MGNLTEMHDFRELCCGQNWDKDTCGEAKAKQKVSHGQMK